MQLLQTVIIRLATPCAITVTFSENVIVTTPAALGVADRKRINAQVRTSTFQWLDSNGYQYIPSQTNFFLLDTRHPAKEVIAAMAKQNVVIGRTWPALPSYSRVTIGTSDEMLAFQQAWVKVMKASVSG